NQRIGEEALVRVELGRVARHFAGGLALPARISVRDSTSTWLRIVSGPAAFSRAWYSARRMSILPCRSRRSYEISRSSSCNCWMSFLRSASDSEARSGSSSTWAFRSQGQPQLYRSEGARLGSGFGGLSLRDLLDHAAELVHKLRGSLDRLPLG